MRRSLNGESVASDSVASDSVVIGSCWTTMV
jgi:hypothetical protein